MRRYGIVLSIAAVVLLAATQFPAAKNSFNFFLGVKSISDLSEDDLGGIDLEKQPDLGIEMSFGGDDWPVMIAVDILASAKDDSASYSYYYYGYYYDADLDVEAATLEVDFGVRKTWEFANNPIRPYIGGGIAGISGAVELDGDVAGFNISEDDQGFGIGYWIGGGVYWKLGDRFNLGFNVRHSKAEIDLDDLGIQNLDVGGTHAGLVLGWGH